MQKTNTRKLLRGCCVSLASVAAAAAVATATLASSNHALLLLVLLADLGEAPDFAFQVPLRSFALLPVGVGPLRRVPDDVVESDRLGAVAVADEHPALLLVGDAHAEGGQVLPDAVHVRVAAAASQSKRTVVENHTPLRPLPAGRRFGLPKPLSSPEASDESNDVR